MAVKRKRATEKEILSLMIISKVNTFTIFASAIRSLPLRHIAEDEKQRPVQILVDESHIADTGNVSTDDEQIGNNCQQDVDQVLELIGKILMIGTLEM